MTNQYGKWLLRIRFAIIFAFGGILLFSLLESPFYEAQSQSRKRTSVTPKAKKAVEKPTPTPDPDERFAHFKHELHIDMGLECSQCHKVPTSNWDKVRDKDKAFPDVTDFPKHDSCLECHRDQFFSGKPPTICRNCHVNPSPDDSTRFAFPNPREIYDQTPKGKTSQSEFAVAFPHDKHIEIVSQNRRFPNRPLRGALFVSVRLEDAGAESCKVCHQTYKPQGEDAEEYFSKPPKDLGDGFWLKKGAFKVSPIGHTICFGCHSADTGIAPAPTDCGTCHKIKQPPLPADFDAALAGKIGVEDKIMLLAWRNRDSSGTFRHEWFSHAELSCTQCHNVLTMKTNEPATKKVPILSCGGDGSGCHVTPTADDGGILNYEIDQRTKSASFMCVKCHITFGKLPVPQSHTDAIKEIAAKSK